MNGYEVRIEPLTNGFVVRSKYTSEKHYGPELRLPPVFCKDEAACLLVMETHIAKRDEHELKDECGDHPF